MASKGGITDAEKLRVYLEMKFQQIVDALGIVEEPERNPSHPSGQLFRIALAEEYAEGKKDEIERFTAEMQRVFPPSGNVINIPPLDFEKEEGMIIHLNRPAIMALEEIRKNDVKGWVELQDILDPPTR